MAKWNSGAGPLGLRECNEGGFNGLGSVNAMKVGSMGWAQ